MVQANNGDGNAITNLLSHVMDRTKVFLGRPPSPTSKLTTPPSSPSKTRRPKNHTSGQTTVVVPVVKREGGRELISYQMAPRPQPEPLPCLLGICYQVCCGGNMKYVVFPTLMAVTLGLFLAFSRAVSSTSLSRGYSHYQNSRQLSEDEPAYMARGHLMFPGILGDHHRAMFNPGEAGLGQHHPLAWRGLGGGGGGIVGGGVGGESCDCSRCELDDSFSETSPPQFKRLVKHSFQHFYGRQELAMQIEAFVPSKTKQWTLSPTFYITASHVCNDAHSLLAVIIVHAHHRHSAERNAIRETWGSVARGNAWPRRHLSGEVRLIFVLEVSDDPIDNDLASKESDNFGDIVLVDVQETQEVASRKILAGFKWVKDYCPEAEHIIKVEEDTFVDVPLLLTLVSSQDLTNMILGPIQFDDPVKRENEKHRVLISRQAYFPDWYPPYAMGSLYVLPTSLTKRMLDVCENIPYINKEDVFITGILAKVFDARHINLPDRVFDRTPKSKPELCDFVYRKRLAAQGISPNFARNLWRRLEKAEMCGLYSASGFR